MSGHSSPGRVPTTRAYDHLAVLVAQGMSLTQVAEAAGVNWTTLSNLRRRRFRRIYRSTEQLILAVRPARPDSERNRVLAVGSARRLGALAAIGWSLDEQARRLGMHRGAVGDIARGKREYVFARTALRITALYDELSMTRGPSARALNTAERHDWPPPLCWDDEDLDDPAPRVVRRAQRRMREGRTETYREAA